MSNVMADAGGDVLRGPRVVLVPQLATHADEMFIVLSDPAIYEHENAPPASVEGLRERYGKLETRRSADGSELWLNWVLRAPGTELIGFVQATVYADRRAAIAYVLASRWWGQGLASEAVRTMMAALATEHGVHDFHAVLKKTNQRSVRLLQRLGFVLATGAEHEAAEVDPDEWLMTLVRLPRSPAPVTG